MNDSELESIWRSIDTRIATINSRTKRHTLEIRELEKEINELKKKLGGKDEM